MKLPFVCNCCKRYETDVWTNGGPACQWCLAACREADECEVLASEPRAGFYFGTPDTSNALDSDPWDPAELEG